jgi:hypothetical protein
LNRVNRQPQKITNACLNILPLHPAAGFQHTVILPLHSAASLRKPTKPRCTRWPQKRQGCASVCSFIRIQMVIVNGILYGKRQALIFFTHLQFHPVY